MAAEIMDSIQVPLSVPQAAIATGVGAITFPVVLGLNQFGMKYLRISTMSGSANPELSSMSLVRRSLYRLLRPITGRPMILIPSAIGGISVTLASLLASATVLQSYSLAHGLLRNNDHKEALSEVKFTAKDLLISTAAGVTFFRALGGRFRSVLPSHLHSPGAFAHQWIPASSHANGSHANGTQRDIITELGRRYGCHSCGTRRASNYIADHQPPTKLERIINSGRQDFYPQCRSCSSIQGGTLHGAVNKISPIITHSRSLRQYHIFLPTSLLLILLKQSSSDMEPVRVVKFATLPPNEGSGVAIPTNATQQVKSKPVEEVKIEKTVTKDATNEDRARSTRSRSNLSGLVTNFPVLIVWQKLVSFIDSFHPVGGFHMTLWVFSVIAAFGTL